MRDQQAGVLLGLQRRAERPCAAEAERESEARRDLSRFHQIKKLGLLQFRGLESSVYCLSHFA